MPYPGPLGNPSRIGRGLVSRFSRPGWEYWASNADWEWGPWCTETGWTQPWIAGTLALRQMKTSLWDLVKQAGIAKDFDGLRRQMLPDEVLVPKTDVRPHSP